MISTLDMIQSHSSCIVLSPCPGAHPVSVFCLHGRDRAAVDSTSAYEVSLQSTRKMNIYLFCIPSVI